MADDHDLARLTLAVAHTGAQLVLVGDHRQLAAIGPGGALAAVLDRHPGIVVVLDDNVRQRDAEERQALAELRDGSVEAAVDWYAGHGRIHVHPTRLETLTGLIDEWTADIAEGKDTALLAWRRADVADLNRLARHRWDQLGRLTGPDLIAPGGRHYAAGDRVVALAPNRDAGIVTSEQLTITAVAGGQVQAVTGAGRTVALAGAAIDAEHLDHAYALTVHRAQGATYERAHVVAAGGGRELAYVAASRARDRTTIHVTADDFAQARDDLRADWDTSYNQRWITDTPAQVGHETASRGPSVSDRLRAFERRAARDPADDLDARIREADLDLLACKRNLRDLHRGRGRLAHTPEGRAARELLEARAELDQAERALAEPRLRRRDRRSAAARAVGARADYADAVATWWEVGEPAVHALEQDVEAAVVVVRDLEHQRLRQLLDHTAERDVSRSLEHSIELERGLEIEPPGMSLGR